MPNVFNSNTFSSTYKDDFNQDNGYHRILFNAGRALQARELTQLQTIIQSELARMGRHMFKEGAAVNPGGITVNTSYEFVKLNTSVNPLPATPSDLTGVELTSDSGIVVRVLEVLEAENSDPATLYVQYLDTSTGTAGANAIRVPAGENLSGGGYTLTAQSINTVANPAVGVGTRVSSQGGDFFAQNHFVYAPKQSFILSKYTSNPTAKVGFKVTQDIITVNDTVELYDNQGVTPNLASPGADRYRISLTLENSANVSEDENFIIVADIDAGEIKSQVLNPTGEQYNRLAEVMALRTSEESGNYIAKPFILTFEENADPTKIDFKLSPGTAYVNGYRAATQAETTVTVSKPRTTSVNNNDVVASNYGNYFLVQGNIGLPNINTLQSVNLYDAVGGSGNSLGTARVRGLEEDGSNYRIYVFDVKMNTGQNERNIRSIGSGPTDYMNIVLENNQAVRKDAASNTLIFPLPQSRVKSLSDISLTVQRRFTTTTDGAGNASISLTSTGETFADTSAWILSPSDSAIDTGASITGAGTVSAAISGATPSVATYEIFAYVNKSAGIVRTKTLTTTTQTLTPDGSGNVQLPHADIYEVTVIKDTDAVGDDVSTIYTVDNGQRDNFYGLGALNIRAGRTAPATVYVEYSYFAHGAAGDFFAVNSYAGQVNYEDIPVYTTSSGRVMPLVEVLDFRPVVNSSGNFGSGARVNELVKPTDLIQFDAEYYLGKNVKVVISEDGEIQVLESEPAADPKAPQSPPTVLDLYMVQMSPYTISTRDVFVNRIPAKRYTMADIGALEDRVGKLEEVTSLSLLELSASAFTVLDETGAIRTKSGFFVDNFTDQNRIDFSREHRASIDPSRGMMRPMFDQHAIRMVFDSNDPETTGVVVKGDNVYLAYTETSYLNQDFVTGWENVNPFAVVTKRGVLGISPATDSWMETRYIADHVVEGPNNFIGDLGTLWDNWSWNWTGDLQVGSSLGSQVTSDSTTWTETSRNVVNRWGTTQRGGNDDIITNWATFEVQGTGVRTVDTESVVISGIDIVREIIGDRTISKTLIPKMRSQKVYFRADALRPNTRVFPFFAGRLVSEWCRQEAFQFMSSTTDEYSTGFENITEHPETPSDLITDANGTIEGSFFIPSTDLISFNTGEKEFKILDVSVNDENEALSIASINYTSTGILDTRQRTVLATRNISLTTQTTTDRTNLSGSWRTTEITSQFRVSNDPDPLAQTFQVMEASGIFVTGVKLRFRSKSQSNVPVIVQIRPTVNGYPSSDEKVPGTVTTLAPAAISTSNDASAITTFQFDEPAYLFGNGTEYAIVILSDSDEYEVYVAEAGAFILGSTEKRVRRQPTLGSLFKSQNARTWEPDQTKDLTFELMRAQFQTNGSAKVKNTGNAKITLPTASLETTNLSDQVTLYLRNHGFTIGDTLLIENAASVGGISAANINGERVVSAIDGNALQFTAGATASASAEGGGNPTIERQFMYNVGMLIVDNVIPDGTLLSYQGKFTSGQSLAGTESAYVKDTDYRFIEPNTNITFTNPRLAVTARNETLNLGGDSSTEFKINMSSVSDYISPVLDLQRINLGLVSNRIDWPVPSGPDGNIPLEYIAETDPSNGTALAKHVTSVTSLAQSATGLKILIAAHKPASCAFDVYYRTNTDGQINTKEWTLIAPENLPPSDENPNSFRDYRYLAGGLTGDLDEFDQFQIKIVMKSRNSSKVPLFKDLRVIALYD